MRILHCCLTVLFIVTIGCSSEGKETSSLPLSAEISRHLDTVKKSYESLPEREELQASAIEETKKLMRFEYHVAEYDQLSDATTIQKELDALGRERWECFSVQHVGDKMRFICKRRPDSVLGYLPYIPKFLL